MSTINMDLVKELREKTQVGMMDCKKALTEANGDMQLAIDILRKRGAAVAAKRADNATDNGRIEAYIASNNKSAALVSVCCETDFSANTEAMKEFAVLSAQEAAKFNTNDIQKLLSEKKNVKNCLDELIAKISEKIEINRLEVMNVVENGIISTYIHPGSAIGVMVELTTANDAGAATDELKALARDICMHIAVTNPLALSPQNLDQALLEKERAIAKEQLEKSGKPANIMDKIIEGKIKKFCSDVCLTSQQFIKNEDVTIEQLVANFSTKTKNPTSIKRFVRLSIGRK